MQNKTPNGNSSFECLNGEVLIYTATEEWMEHCKDLDNLRDEIIRKMKSGLRSNLSLSIDNGFFPFNFLIKDLRIRICLSAQVVRAYAQKLPESSLRGMEFLIPGGVS